MNEENWEIQPQEEMQAEAAGEMSAGEEAASSVAQFGKAMKALSDEYPDMEELPAAVAEEILSGKEPSSALLRYENRQLKAQLAAEQRNRENRERAFGSALGSAEGGENDPFLSGFDAAFKD